MEGLLQPFQHEVLRTFDIDLQEIDRVESMLLHVRIAVDQIRLERRRPVCMPSKVARELRMIGEVVHLARCRRLAEAAAVQRAAFGEPNRINVSHETLVSDRRHFERVHVRARPGLQCLD